MPQTRKKAAKNDLPDVRLERTVNDQRWMENYRKLKAFRKANGHFRVPQTFDDQIFATWVKNQKYYQKTGRLRSDCVQLLNELKVNWGEPGPTRQRRAQPVPWMGRYKQLVAFKKRNGHIQVSGKDNKELQDWVNTQRSWKRNGLLRQDRERLLNKIGFSWVTEETVPLKSSNVQWMNHYKRLAAFKQKHGHFNVPAATLDEWMCYQRYCKENGKLSKDKQKLLDKIGFAWAPGNRSIAEFIAVPVHALMENSETGKAPSKEVTSSSIAKETSKMNQKFAVGTQIEKAFEVDGVSQTFGGNVTAFELFEDEDGTQHWGYMIHYDDGDREHMLEADVATIVDAAKRYKRAPKSQAAPTASKRLKHANAPGTIARSIALKEKTSKPISVQPSTEARDKTIAPKKPRESRHSSRSVDSRA